MSQLRVTTKSAIFAVAVVLIGSATSQAIVSDYVVNASSTWSTATNWSTNPTIPNAVGDTAQRIVAFTNNRTLTQDIAEGVTVGSILYGDNNDLGSRFWRVTIPAGNTLTFNQDGTDPGFATFRNSNTNTGNLNALFFNTTGSVVLADDLHVINASGSTNINGGVQLASPVTGTGNITFISDSPISSTDTSSPGSISFHSPNTFIGTSLIQKGLVVAFNSATPFGDAANVVTLGVSGQGSAAILSRNADTPINYAITVAAAALGETRTFGSAAETDYTVSSGNITLNGDLNLRAGTTSTTFVQEYSGIFSGVGSLTKTGPAVAKLTGINTYTGNTAVQAGSLSITSPYLANAANVLLTTGSILDLNFEGTDTINALLIDDVSQALGTWGGVGSGATHETSLLTGTGFLLVSSATLAGDHNADGKVDAADYVVWRKTNINGPTGYTTWRANFGNPPGSGSGLGTSSAVPEPTALILLMTTIGIVSCRRVRIA